MTTPDLTRDELLAEIARLRTELDNAQALAADATEYRIPLPENGGTTLLVRRQAGAHGTGWAVGTMAPGGGRAWTTEGWQESISTLSVDRLFCWPDATTATAEARSALATPHPQADVMPHDRAEYDRMRDTNPRPGPCCTAAGPVPHWPMWAHCGGGNGPGKPIRPHCTCDSCF